MKPIEELFVVHRAKSGLFIDYEKGDVAYVGNSMADNAVTGFVKPLPTDKVFDFAGIAVSAFCEASVQTPPFIACGRAGNGLVVLEPKSAMSIRQLAYIAAYINLAVRWRFNWYRQTTADRIKPLLVPSKVPPAIKWDVKDAKRRAEHGTQEPVATVRMGRGSCRDFALLMIEAVRSLGLAARFVFGYLYVPSRDGPENIGGGSTHAWCQVYLPGAGWVEFDPTNGIIGNRDLIRVAVARDPNQAIPLSGTYAGSPDDDLGMKVQVNVICEAVAGDSMGASAS
jgi:Transglutaminase-like superfamily